MSEKCPISDLHAGRIKSYGAIPTVFKLIWYDMDAEIEIKTKRQRPPAEATLEQRKRNSEARYQRRGA
jgi:hypothetical protein